MLGLKVLQVLLAVYEGIGDLVDYFKIAAVRPSVVMA